MHWLEVFRNYSGPTLKVFQALDNAVAAALGREILELIDRYNVATDGTMVVPSDDLEVVIDR